MSYKIDKEKIKQIFDKVVERFEEKNGKISDLVSMQIVITDLSIVLCFNSNEGEVYRGEYIPKQENIIRIKLRKENMEYIGNGMLRREIYKVFKDYSL